MMAVVELMADAEIMADTELMADAELMADTKLMADEEDVLDYYGEIPEQFEEFLDNHEKLLILQEDSYSLCNDHTALSNGSRFEEIKIGDSEVLVFFDRGANIHIIDGSLVEKEGLQRVSSSPTSLTVVGENSVRSNHGTFGFNLGSGDNGVKIEMSNAVLFARDQVPIQEEVFDDSGGVEDELLGLSVLAAGAGKGVAVELLIDLEFEESLDDHEKLLSLLEDSYSLCNVHNAQVNVQRFRGIRDDIEPGVAEELLIDLEMDVAELEKARFQPRIQTPEKVGCLEIFGEKLLIDMSPAELEELRFQSGTQTPDTVGYLENLGENVVTDEETALTDKENHAVYKRTDEFRKTDDFKRTNDFRKTDDFKRTDDNPDKIDGFKRTDDFKRTDINPDRIDDFRRTDYFKKTEKFKRTDEIYCSGVGFSEMLWIDEISWAVEISWFSKSSWFEEISWYGEDFWFEEISWFSEDPWFEEISWFSEDLWFEEISWFSEDP